MESKYDARVLHLPPRGQQSPEPGRSLPPTPVAQRKWDVEYRRIMDATKQGIWTIDFEGRTTFVNDRMAELLGYTPEEMLGRVHTDFMWEEDRPQGDEELELRRQGKSRVWDQRYRRKDGTELWTLASRNSLFDEDGRVVGALGMFADISERKRAESDLRNNRELISIALRSAKAGVWSWDTRTNELNWSPEQYELFGLDPGTPVTFAQWEALVHPRDRERLRAFAEALRASSQEFRTEFRVRTSAGERWIFAVGRLERDSRGNAERYVGINLDITDRRIAESKIRKGRAEAKRTAADLEQREHFLKRIADVNPGVLNVFDLRTRRNVYINQSVESLLGYTPEEIHALGSGIIAFLMHPEDVPRFEEHLVRLQALPDHEIAMSEFRMRDRQGRWHWFTSRDSVFTRDSSGAVQQIVGIAIEITELKVAEQGRWDSERRERKRADELAVLLESVPVSVFIARDSSHAHITGNRLAEALMRQPRGGELSLRAPGEARPRHFRLMKDGRELAPEERPSWRAGRGEQVRDFEFSFVFDDGEVRHVSGYANPLLDDLGRPCGSIASLIDITERKQAEEALRASQATLEAALESMMDGLLIVDAAGNIIAINEAFAKMYRFKSKEECSKSFDELARLLDVQTLSGDPIPPEMWATQRALRGEKSTTLEYVIRRRDTGEAWIGGSSFSSIRDARGLIVGAVVTTRDITDRKRSERALLVSEARYRNLSQSIPAMLWAADVRGATSDHNRRWLEYTGQTADQARGEGWKEVVHPEDVVRVAERWAHSVASGSPYSIEYRLRRASDGAYRWHEVQAELQKDEEGNALGWFGTCIDVEDRRQAEAALRATEQRVRVATEATGVGIWEWRTLSNDIRWDAEMFRIYGIAPTSSGWVDYSTWRNAVVPEEVADNEAVLQDTVRRRGRSTRTFRIRRHNDGSLRHIESVETVRINERGEVECVVGTNLDVTERKRIEAELLDAARRKDEFLATLAHELRNPLAPVRNALRILHRRCPDVPEVHWATEVIDRQVQAMSRLIEDLMDVSRVNQGKVNLQREHCDLAKVVHEAVESSRPLIEEREHTLVVNQPTRPVIVDADPTRLCQILLNLLNNAAKYTERGGRIELTLETSGNDLLVSVRDTGIGIPADQLQSIFEMFSQVDGALSRSQGGLGIGLNLVKRLVSKHGGTIEARSAGLGRGSEFIARLPIIVSVDAHLETMTDDGVIAAPPSLRILVVDDNRDAAESAAMLFGMLGNTVECVYDGDAAISAAESFRPDVVLCDIGLPKCNGYQVARAIRENPRGKDMLLIALTGWGRDDDRSQALQAGFDHHLTKPVSPENIQGLLAALHPSR